MAVVEVTGNKVKMVFDEANPEEKAYKLLRAYENIPLDKIPATAKGKIFDAFVMAGLIKL